MHPLVLHDQFVGVTRDLIAGSDRAQGDENKESPTHDGIP